MTMCSGYNMNFLKICVNKYLPLLKEKFILNVSKFPVHVAMGIDDASLHVLRLSHLFYKGSTFIVTKLSELS